MHKHLENHYKKWAEKKSENENIMNGLNKRKKKIQEKIQAPTYAAEVLEPFYISIMTAWEFLIFDSFWNWFQTWHHGLGGQVAENIEITGNGVGYCRNFLIRQEGEGGSWGSLIEKINIVSNKFFLRTPCSKVPAKIIRPPIMRWRRTLTEIPSLQRRKIEQVTWLLNSDLALYLRFRRCQTSQSRRAASRMARWGFRTTQRRSLIAASLAVGWGVGIVREKVTGLCRLCDERTRSLCITM